MSEEIKKTVVPSMMTELEWVWVLTSPITRHRDSIFVLELEDRDGGGRRRVVPVFEHREDAALIKGRLCGEKAEEHSEHSMRLSEVGEFAAKNKLEIMLLDAKGTIVAHLEARVEQVPVH